MAANTDPIYVISPHLGIGTAITTANANMDGTGTVVTLYTAGANGAFAARVIVRALGTNAQTVVRIFVNNGSTNATATNNVLVREQTLPITTASNTAQQPDFDIPLNFGIDPGFRILMTIGTNVATGIIGAFVGGDY